ncbi:MAG: hypothetical protein M3S32_01765 [Acidobacteriota bacterium]|nr:hypothetical protein [Acidobacteriota bacterium]
MSEADSEASARGERLASLGASPGVVRELFGYDTPLFTPERAVLAFDFAGGEEPHLEAWSRYAEEARVSGAIPALAARFSQLLFPVRQGISATESYRRATRQGIRPDGAPEATGIALAAPERVTIEIARTPTGPVPVLVAPHRADFESLVRAFSARNEPVAVPPSMGACIVTGLNNWDRLNEYRRKWQAANLFGDWAAEFASVASRREIYEDRFLILSVGPYSGVPASGAGFEEREWLDLSGRIRQAHEATHYATFRLAGAMRNNLLDEVIADYVGLLGAFGEYRLDLALRFFGLESFPKYREGGRLQNYRGDPPLSDDALAIAARLVHDAAQSLAGLPPLPAGGGERAVRDRVIALGSLRLDELAAAGARLAERLDTPPREGVAS